MATVDWIALAVVVLAALTGWRRGLVASALSLGGLALGAYAGSRLAPHLLSGGSASPWASLVSLAGALAGAGLLLAVASAAGRFVRGGLKLTPLRFLDSAGGIVLGALGGLALVWVAAAVALLLPGQTTLRRDVQRSQVVRRLDSAVSPRHVLNLLARIDPFPSITGPAAPASPTTRAIARNPLVRAARLSVVKVLGTACGVGVEGSGWFARATLVVTAAHVVAGEHDTAVLVPGEGRLRRADVVVFDPHDDVAVLRVRGASRTPLPFGDPQAGRAVAILGYPENGPLTVVPGRVGKTTEVLTRDAYGRGPVGRMLTAVAGRVRHGNSGGPAVDARGRAVAEIFAARVGSDSGFGVPASILRRDVGRAQRPVSTGGCAAG